RRGRGQMGPRQPTLERTNGGEGLPGFFIQPLHPDQRGSPGGVLAAAVQSGLHDVRSHGWGRWLAITRRNARRAVATEPLEQTVDRRARNCEHLGDFGGRALLLPEPENG